MKTDFLKGKSLRTRLVSVITAVSIAVLVCLNLLFAYLFRENVILLDLTPEGFYTLSDNMVAACDEILLKEDENGNKRQVEITFCCEPDYLVGNDHLRVTYFMALSLQKRYDNVKVKEVDALRNPTALSKYKTTSKNTIATNDIIFSYGSKYRVVSNESFWFENDFSYDGEYRAVSILASLLAVNNPAAYFVTNRGCSYYDPENPDSEMSVSLGSLYDMLTEQGLRIKLLDLKEAESVPEDCVLLIVNDPREDFTDSDADFDRFDYVSETEKIDRYLVNDAGALIVNKGIDVDLPVFESFLSEWGIAFGDALVKDKDNSLETDREPGTTIIGVYDTSEDGVGVGYYGEYSSLQSAPKMIFNNTGYIYNSHPDSEYIPEVGGYNTTRVYSHFIGTSDNALAYDVEDGGLAVGEGRKSLAAISSRSYLDNETSVRTNSYIFATNSSEFFSNELLGNPSYANYSVMSTVVANISRTDRHASINLGGGSINSPTYGGKQTVSTTLSETSQHAYNPDGTLTGRIMQGFGKEERVVYSVIVFGIPVILAGFGVAMYIRRKFL